MKVYLSIKEMDNAYGVKILAASSSKEEAIIQCLNEPSFAKNKWMQHSNIENCWHNGYGLRVKVLEFDIKHSE